MPTFTPIDDGFEARLRAGFGQQQVMVQLRAELRHVGPGEVQIAMPFDEAWTQQHGFVHAGIITVIVDSACGFAAYTLMPPDAAVLTVEYKVNFLSPARGERFIATGRVLKAGRTLTVCSGEVIAIEGGAEKPVAVMQATMMAMR
jgi:uncharacterized protein (TIGR00369 family)